MRKKSSISLGPGAPSLILIFVVLSLSVLGMLCLMGSRNDLRLSERSAQVVETVYQLNADAEERRGKLGALLAGCARDAADEDAYLEAVAAALPEDMSLTDRTVSWTHLVAWEGMNSLRQLDYAVELAPLGETPRAKWVKYDMAAATSDAALSLYARLEEAAVQPEEGFVRRGGHLTRTELTSSWDSEEPLALTGVLDGNTSADGAPVWLSCYLKPVTDEALLGLMAQADEAFDLLYEAAEAAAEAVLDGSYTEVDAATAAYQDAVRAELHEGAVMEDGIISWEAAAGSQRLLCRAELNPLWEDDVLIWRSRALVAEGSAE